MVEYRRIFRPGGCYFFTQVAYERKPWLCTPGARGALRNAIVSVRREWPFIIAAWVLLPEHLHCIWRLPEGDSAYSTRWRLIKTFVTKHREESWGQRRRVTLGKLDMSKHFGSAVFGNTPCATTRIIAVTAIRSITIR